MTNAQVKIAIAIALLAAAVAVGALALLAGCQTAPKVSPPPMPTVSGNRLQSAGYVSALAVIPAPSKKTVTLAWSCAASPNAANWLTGIESRAGGDSNWTEVVYLPYATSNLVTLSNQPVAGLFRAFTRLK